MDKQQFEHTVGVCRGDFYRLALRMLGNHDDADDVAQDVLLRLWDIRDRLGEYASVKALGLTVTRHKCIDRLRSVAPTAPLEEASALDVGTASAEQQLIDADEATEVSRLIEQLPEGQRQVLKMRHILGMDTAEIAAATGAREATVRVALSRGRSRLRDLYNESQNEK